MNIPKTRELHTLKRVNVCYVIIPENAVTKLGEARAISQGHQSRRI